MTQVVRPYRGVSAEERRSLRRARLIEAALDVLGSEGLARTTMSAVCARAGLTERYFYEAFSGRDELLRALFRGFSAQTDAAVLAAVAAAPADLLERSRAAIGALIGALTDDPRKARAYLEAIGSEALREMHAKAVRAYASLLAREMRELYALDSRRHREPLRLATLVIVGGVEEAVNAWLEGGLALSRQALVDECAQLCVAAAESVKASAA